MTKVQELQQEMASTLTAAQAALDANKLDEARELKNKAAEIKDMIAMQKDIDAEMKATLENTVVPKIKEDKKVDGVKAFATAIRSRFKNTLVEDTNEDGGYTVPEDISTMINEYRSASASLIDLVDVEGVSTKSGARTFKKRSQQTGFSEVGEGTAIGVGATPQFERITYSIKKYAGALPVTNELLKDTDANLVGTITKWIAEESRVTRNKLILAQIQSKTAVTIDGLDGIKEALNVTLGQAFKPTSKIITNDDGLQYLDTLKDANDRYMLQPNPTDPAKIQLCAGATVVPVVVLPNSDLETDASNGIPFIIGDLKEGIKFFDRQMLTITSSDIATIGDFNAFEQDMTLYRAIEREDVKIKDAEAFVYGYVATSA